MGMHRSNDVVDRSTEACDRRIAFSDLSLELLDSGVARVEKCVKVCVLLLQLHQEAGSGCCVGRLSGLRPGLGVGVHLRM